MVMVWLGGGVRSTDKVVGDGVEDDVRLLEKVGDEVSAAIVGWSLRNSLVRGHCGWRPSARHISSLITMKSLKRTYDAYTGFTSADCVPLSA